MTRIDWVRCLCRCRATLRAGRDRMALSPAARIEDCRAWRQAARKPAQGSDFGQERDNGTNVSVLTFLLPCRTFGTSTTGRFKLETSHVPHYVTPCQSIEKSTILKNGESRSDVHSKEIGILQRNHAIYPLAGITVSFEPVKQYKANMSQIQTMIAAPYMYSRAPTRSLESILHRLLPLFW